MIIQSGRKAKKNSEIQKKIMFFFERIKMMKYPQLLSFINDLKIEKLSPEAFVCYKSLNCRIIQLLNGNDCLNGCAVCNR